MAVSAEYLVYALEQLRAATHVRTRKMFGEIGLYADDTFFGIIAEDALYLKTDDDTRRRYLEAGSEPFEPVPGSRSMSYFAVPAEVLEAPEALARWVNEAVAVGARAKKLKRK